jgi:hypothetical protein
MTALPAFSLSVLTNGADIGRGGGKSAVTKAVLQVMLSAQRVGWHYVDMHRLLADTKSYRLAAQLAAGYGGRKIPAAQREAFMRQLWDKAEKVASQRPPWTHDDVLGAIELVRQELDATGADLGEQERAVIQAVLDLADLHGTTRVAAPVRQVAKAAGLSRMEAHRALIRLCERGEWLVLARRGTSKASDSNGGGTGRSNLYQLSPDLLRTYKGASPPKSHGIPMSQIPMSQGEDPVRSAVNYEVTAAEDEAIAKVLEAIRIGAAGTTPEIRVTDQAGNVVQLDSKRRRPA